MDDDGQLARLARTLRHLLVASYGLRPDDVAREVADAARHLDGEDVVLLLCDYDQQWLVGFDVDDERSFRVDDPGPGSAFRTETTVIETLDGGGRRLWMPVKDSAERLGVLGVIDDGSIEVDLWETVASLVGELIVSKSAYGDHITRRRRRAPFSLPAEMRWGLLPPLTYTGPDVTIAGFLQPSHGIAGDAFDYAVTGRSASVAVFDAMGHGMESSRLASVSVAAYRNSRRTGVDPAATLRAIDAVLTEQFGDSRFVTAQVAELDLDTGQMVIANAGHPPPLLLRHDHDASELPCEPSRPAGIESEPSTLVTQLEPDDAVLFRTDGITDARDAFGEAFSDERLGTLLRGLIDARLSPAEVLRHAVHATVEHQAGRPGDDATMVMVRWTPSGND